MHTGHTVLQINLGTHCSLYADFTALCFFCCGRFVETLDLGGSRQSDRREIRVLGAPSRRAANYIPGTAVPEPRVSSEGSQVLMGPCQGVGGRQGPQVGAEWRCANFYVHALFAKIGVVYKGSRACERIFCDRTRYKLVFFW